MFSGVDDDVEDEISSNDGYGSWLGNIFDVGVPPVKLNKLPASAGAASPEAYRPPTQPPPPTQSGWFNDLLNFEDDDGAYSANTSATASIPRKPSRRGYKGYQLLRVVSDAAWKVKELRSLRAQASGAGLAWWTPPALHGAADLLVPPDLLADIKDHLDAAGLDYDVVIWDLQKAIAYENPRLSKKQRLELEKSRGHPLTWRRYHRYADILRYMEYLSLQHPDMVELVPLGRSSEGLPLVAVKISSPNGEPTKTKNDGKVNGNRKRWRLKSRARPAVWLDAGLRGREWIAPAVATWILHALVEGEKGQGPDKEMLKIAEWYIMPVANPDGYEHSHTTDRLWHKTRSRHSTDDNYYNSWFPWNWGRTDCEGVDPYLNWDFHWGEKGVSNDPCSDDYPGPYPFSEPETKAISDFLMNNKEQMKVYLSLHSYSQMWLVPSSQSRTPHPDVGSLMEMGKLAVTALGDVWGTRYSVGTASELLQPTTGMPHEWAKSRAGIKYAYSVKMRDSQGPYGYLLPGSQIIPTAKETWEAIKAIVDNLN